MVGCPDPGCTTYAGHGGRAAFKAGILSTLEADSQNFNFPEHPFFLKYIKKSLRKSKKCEKIKNFHFFRKSEKFRES